MAGAEKEVKDVDAYRPRKVQEGRLSPRTINRTLSTLVAVLEPAQE